MALQTVTPPAVEPVSLDEAKAHLRVTHDAEDERIARLIKMARQWVELYLNRALITQTLQLIIDDFPAYPSRSIRLPRPPLQEVGGIAYVGLDDALQTWPADEYQVAEDGLVWRVLPAPRTSWPTAGPRLGAVSIEFTAGYGDAGTDVPEPIRQAILLVVGQQYAHGEGTEGTAPGVSALLWPYRVMSC